MRHMLSIPDAADCSSEPEDRRRFGSGGCQDTSRGQRCHGEFARQDLRLQEHQARRNVPSGVSTARPASEERSLEGPANGDEASWRAVSIELIADYARLAFKELGFRKN